MAGKNSGFNAKAFRTAIRQVYDMAAPPVSDEQATFFFPAQLVYNVGTDAEGTPFDPTATVTRTQPDPVKVPCALDFKGATDTTDFGILAPAKVAITLLDDDYAQVEGFTYVVIRGEKYNFESVDPPSGLFDVGLYTVHVRAETQT